MRIYYDTEFVDDGKTIDLISIGMIAEDGRQFYGVVAEIEQEPVYGKITRNNWLMMNVVPHLPLRPGRDSFKMPEAQHSGRFILDDEDNTVMPRRMIRNAVRGFILETPDVELWAWYGAYDHVALAQLFGPMSQLPKGIPMWTNDLRQEYARLGEPLGLPPQPGGLHNALADAHHLKRRAEWLQLEGSQ